MAFTERWEPARVERVKELFEAGVSMLLIAEQLDLTLGKVAGKIYRLRHRKGVFFKRARTLVQKERQKPLPRVRLSERQPYTPRIVEEVKRADAAPPEASFDNIKGLLDWLNDAPVERANLTFAELTYSDGRPQECRYIVSDHPTLYCGRKVSGISSWCPNHRKLVTQAPQPRSAPRAKIPS